MIQGIARIRIHPGKLEEFKRLSSECMRLACKKDTGTLRYAIFFSANENECVVNDEYVVSGAAIRHFENTAAIFPIVACLSDPSS